ncbi:retrovirus-related pol polyprotein from transposon TNT 1-94 [Tanacetum coccineum]
MTMLDTSYGEETMEELTAAVMLMAQIQPADGNTKTVPSYDAKAVSEVNASSKVHDQMSHVKRKTIIYTSDDDQIDSNIIFDDPFVENNGGISKHDSNAHVEYNNIQMLAYNVQREVENKKRLNNELKKQKEPLQKELEMCVESSNSVRRPKSKDTKLKNRVLKNTNAKSSTTHVWKLSRSASIDSNKHETNNSNVCQSNASVLNTKTVNAVNDGSNIVCVSYGKDVFLLSHEKCVNALSRNSYVKRALFTTPIAAKSKNLGATSVVAQSRLSVAKTPTATNRVSSVLPLSPDSSQSRTLIQRNLKAQILMIRTDNRTEFKNKKLWAFYAKLGIVHKTSIARTPQQNGVVERRNRTLVEAARTMLIFSKSPEFLWAEAIASACFTQNRSIVHTRYNKTPYELIRGRTNIQYFYVFRSLCYPANDRDDLGKMKLKANISIFIGYSESSRGFCIFKCRTKKIIEMIYVKFDELTAMASECNNLEPETNCTNFQDSSEDSQSIPSKTYLDNLFGPLYEEYYATSS